MPSQEKLIKQGIKYTDSLFAEISKRIEQGVLSTDTLEAFLDKYHKAYPDNGNPLVTLGYDKEMIRLILSETNNHKFTRPSQKELVRVTIENRVGENIVDVGDEIRDSVRDIVKDGYNNRLSQDEIAENISSKVTGIKNRRARAIARTEIARAATVSDYIINKEMGATHFYVECRNTACPVCKKAWHSKWTEANDESFTPKEYTAGKKGWVGDKVYSIGDTKQLPPIHPNSYHKDTQVFTEHGWKYIAELTGDEKLLSLNPDDDSLEFIKPVRLFKHKEPQLVHMHNKWFDVCVTPDHDCFVHKRRDGGKKGRYFEPQFRKPSDLNSECHFVRCIDTDRESPEAININGLEFEPKDFAFFMAWYISEGSVLHDVEKAQKRKYPIYIAQQISENREIIRPVLEKMCDYLGLKMNISKNSFVIYSKELYDYLLPLGYSNEKYIPPEVFTLSKECLNVFLDNYVRGDGHERTHGRYNSVERSVFTSSVRLRDDLSYLILLCGYCPSISLHSHKGTVVEHRNGTYTQNYDIYGIRINSSKYASYSGLIVDRVDYDDYTYCVELPKWHTLWVMRNGKTSWNGNCRCVPYFITENEKPKDAGMVEPTTRETTTRQTETTYSTQSQNKTSDVPKWVGELSENQLKRYNRAVKDIEKGTKMLAKLKEDDPRRLMYDARMKSAQKILADLEKESKTPKTPKQQYPIPVDTPQEVLNLKEELGAKNVYSEITKRNKHTFDVYEFEDFTIAMDRELFTNHLVSVKELRDHMRWLPKELRTTGARVSIQNIMDLEAQGYYWRDSHEVEMNNNGNRCVKSKEGLYMLGMETHTILDAVTHEVAHSYDLKDYEYLKGNVASKEVWGAICKEDDKLYKYRDERTGRMRTPRKFPTDYAAESWYKASRSSNYDDKATQYCEDFAESTKLYLNPRTHDKFVKEFPNRANFLKECFGEPNFKNCIIESIEVI